MAATNRVDMLDLAILRPGRFDRLVQVPLPDAGARREILRIHSSPMHLGTIDLEEIVRMTDQTTGADLQSICREAGMNAVRRGADEVEQSDFLAAVKKVRSEPPALDNRMYT
jgi:proteasome regulatory subunit